MVGGGAPYDSLGALLRGEQSPSDEGSDPTRDDSRVGHARVHGVDTIFGVTSGHLTYEQDVRQLGDSILLPPEQAPGEGDNTFEVDPIGIEVGGR